MRTLPLLFLVLLGCAGAERAHEHDADAAATEAVQHEPRAAHALPATPGREVLLVDGDLDAWEALGDALYTADGGEVLGAIGGGSQSFLVTRERFGDFVLELDVRTELPGNSGIQVRSHLRPNGRLFGYQLEIDPSERAWSGGLYDEARRGWLDDLSENPAGRAAFHHGEWNHYRIVCDGPWIRCWVNGVPTADYVDPLDLEGVIGLQVHSGNNTRVRWRDLRLSDLGTRRWRPTHLGDWSYDGAWARGAERIDVPASPAASNALAPSGSGGSGDSAGDLALRLRVRDPEGRLRLAIDPGDPLRPADAEGWLADEPNDLFVYVRDARAVVQVNGRLLADRRAAEGARARLVQLVVAAGQAPVELTELERLGPAE